MSNKRKWNLNDNDTFSNEISDQMMLCLKVFMAGSLSAIFCAFTLQPLDVIKTRLQTPNYEPIKHGKYKSSVLNILVHIKEYENVRMLWAGTVPTLIRSIPSGGIYFTAYDWIKHQFFPHERLTALQAITIGMLARTITDTSVIPLTVLKTRMESGVYKFNGVWSGLKHIYVHEGWAGLTSGLLAMLARDVPMSGLYVTFYIQSEEVIPNDIRAAYPSLVHSSCAAFAGFLASAVTHPPDVVKTQMQLFPDKYHTTWLAVSDIWKRDGFFGYFQGLLPRLIKRTIFAAVSWTLYEKVKEKHVAKDVKVAKTSLE